MKSDYNKQLLNTKDKLSLYDSRSSTYRPVYCNHEKKSNSKLFENSSDEYRQLTFENSHLNNPGAYTQRRKSDLATREATIKENDLNHRSSVSSSNLYNVKFEPGGENYQSKNIVVPQKENNATSCNGNITQDNSLSVPSVDGKKKKNFNEKMIVHRFVFLLKF